MKDEFLAILSHEIRTPLSAIVGWATILSTGLAGPEEIQDGLAVIERNAKVQAQILEDLLDISRIISGACTSTFSGSMSLRLLKPRSPP